MAVECVERYSVYVYRCSCGEEFRGVLLPEDEGEDEDKANIEEGERCNVWLRNHRDCQPA